MSTAIADSDEKDQALNSILKTLQNLSQSSLPPDELSNLITAFLPTHTAEYHSKAYVVLSAFCQATRKSTSSSKTQSSDGVTQVLANVLAPGVASRLGDVEEIPVMAGITFLTALFQVDQEAAISILLRDGVIDSVADAVDLFSSPEIELEVAHLFGQASGHKSCREVISARSLQWLEGKSRQTTNTTLRAAAGVALIKLVKGKSSDSPNLTGTEDEDGSTNDDELAKFMKRVVISGDSSSLPDAMEGLAYLSVNPSLKEDLSRDAVLLAQLFSLVPRRNRASPRTKTISSSLLHGVAVVISNICIYPPRLSEEAAQIEKLKRIVKTGKRTGEGLRDPGTSTLDDDDHCMERARRLVTSGVLEVLTAITYATESHGTRLYVGKAFLSIVENKENRGKVLQSGGAKALALIIRQFVSPSNSASSAKTPDLNGDQLSVIQALAKLAITSSPMQVFGPNQGAMYDAIRPLALLLLHPSSNLLQCFEAMMALTNLSSTDPELASRVASAENLIDKVEMFLLEDHVLVRRAATELLCNLIAGCDELFEKYSKSGRKAEAKLQVLLALADVQDLQTRLAASGTLATLTAAPSACHALFDLQLKRRRVLPIFTRLIDPSSLILSEGNGADEDVDDESNPGLVHRGVVCARNFLVNIRDAGPRKQMSTEAEKVGLMTALVKIARDQTINESISRPAGEALTWLLESMIV
jgi:Myosin-binding striated muscle assembly central